MTQPARETLMWTSAHDDIVTVYPSGDGWRWRVQAPNGEIVGQGESHPRKQSAVEAAERHHPPVASEA